MSNANEPVFPKETQTIRLGEENITIIGESGLTKREYMAALCLQGLAVQAIPCSSNTDTVHNNADKARHAVRLADALLTELSKTAKESEGESDE